MASLSALIAQNLRAERHRSRLTQKQLAERLGWSDHMVSEAETGGRKITLDDVLLFCRALGVPQVDLIKGADADDLRDLGL